MKAIDKIRKQTEELAARAELEEAITNKDLVIAQQRLELAQLRREVDGLKTINSGQAERMRWAWTLLGSSVRPRELPNSKPT